MFSHCLSSNEILVFTEGRARDEDVAGFLHHLDHCDLCRLSVGAASETRCGSQAGKIRTLSDGEFIGRYRIKRLVGRGGMGEVYESTDEILQERVALKTVRLSFLDDSQILERLKSEVLLARRVSHHNVCRVFEFGLHRRQMKRGGFETIPYLTMQFLEGETLAARLARRGRIAWREAIPWVEQMAWGLMAIHREGIVHGDFKSDNIFIVDDANESGARMVVTDFGLARQYGKFEAQSRGIATPAGTLNYMAPEQIRGFTVRPTTDVFALGVVIFEMLTGCLPRDAAVLSSGDAGRLYEEPPSVSTLVPGIPRTWDSFFRRCLAADVQERYQTAVDVIRGIQDIARQDRPQRSFRWPSNLTRPNRWILLLIGTSIFLVSLTLAYNSNRLDGQISEQMFTDRHSQDDGFRTSSSRMATGLSTAPAATDPNFGPLPSSSRDSGPTRGASSSTQTRTRRSDELITPNFSVVVSDPLNELVDPF